MNINICNAGTFSNCIFKASVTVHGAKIKELFVCNATYEEQIQFDDVECESRLEGVIITKEELEATRTGGYVLTKEALATKEQ